MTRRSMPKKGVGSKRGRARRRGSLFLAIAVGVLLIFTQSPSAVHDTGAFELDGNAVSTSSADDWSDVFGDTNSASATSFNSDDLLNDGPSLQATIFTGGGSKDGIDINQWAWKDGAGGLPDKDNLLHSFAARYSLTPTFAGGHCPNGTGDAQGNGFDPSIPCEVLYFGSDRYDNSGDAQQGFWFFQNEISLGTTKLGGGFNFNGVHENGDLLIISDFSNGGTTSTISVYVWDTSVSGNLRLLQTSSAANCATAGVGDAFCGIVNPGPGLTTSPWPFMDKSGNTNFANGEFYEGGVNLSTLGLGGECFATVASESRSSTSTTATLKDFVLGGFARCDSGIVTTPKDGSGNNIAAGGLSIGSGIVSVKDSAELTVTGGAPAWTGTLVFHLCGPIASGTCDTGGTQVDSQTVTNATQQPVLSAAATITSVGRYCWRADFTSGTTGIPDASDSAAAECFTVNPVNTSLPTTASANIQLGTTPPGTISDSAALSGTATKPGNPIINGAQGSAAGGTITFNLYGPNNATCSGTPIFTATVQVSGDGSYGSGNYTPTAVGTYRWVATYASDSTNTNGTSGACNDAGESVVVNAQPAISTVQTFTVKDSATITVADGAGNLEGSIRFQLFNNANCTPGAGNVNILLDSGAIPVSGASPKTITTGTLEITTSKPVLSWLVVYTNTANNQANVTSVCDDEHAELLINNDNKPN